MTDAPPDDAARLWSYVETWQRAVADFLQLARSLDEEQGDLATDLEGWNVRDLVAHTAHLEAILAGAPEETIEVAEAPHIRGLMGLYTEQGVLARRGRTIPALCDELEEAVARRSAALKADPPTDAKAAPPKVFGGLPWPNEQLLSNRPFDVWMHEQDIRRAVGRPGGYDSPAAAHAIAVLGRALPMVLGKRVSPSPGTGVVVSVPEAGRTWGVRVGDDGRAAFGDVASPAVRITLSAEDFVVLGGGRRTVDRTSPAMVGDTELGQALLESLAVTP